MQDLKKASVDIVIANDGRLWVNVDEECVLRVKDADVTIVHAPEEATDGD